MVGLRKIDEATEQLIILNEQLEIQKIVVAEKTLACEIILQEISEGKNTINSKICLNIILHLYIIMIATHFDSMTFYLYC